MQPARRRCSSRSVHADVRAERVHVGLERLLEKVDVTRPPELPFERPRLGQDGPGAVGERLAGTDPVEHETETPLAHSVAEKQEMAAAQLRRERDRDRAADVATGEVADVVVLGYDEALLLAAGGRVERAVQLQDDRTPVE